MCIARRHAEVLNRVEVGADRVRAQVGTRAHLKGVGEGYPVGVSPSRIGVR